MLSDAFFSKRKPQSELDALVELQNARGRKVILPVWLNITTDMVRSRSPLLASRLAARSPEGMDKVVSDLLRVLRSPNRLNQARPRIAFYGADTVNTVPKPRSALFSVP